MVTEHSSGDKPDDIGKSSNLSSGVVRARGFEKAHALTKVYGRLPYG